MIRDAIFLVIKITFAVMIGFWIRFNLSVFMLIVVPSLCGAAVAEWWLPQPKKRNKVLFPILK